VLLQKQRVLVQKKRQSYFKNRDCYSENKECYSRNRTCYSRNRKFSSKTESATLKTETTTRMIGNTAKERSTTTDIKSATPENEEGTLRSSIRHVEGGSPSSNKTNVEISNEKEAMNFFKDIKNYMQTATQKNNPLMTHPIHKDKTQNGLKTINMAEVTSPKTKTYNPILHSNKINKNNTKITKIKKEKYGLNNDESFHDYFSSTITPLESMDYMEMDYYDNGYNHAENNSKPNKDYASNKNGTEEDHIDLITKYVKEVEEEPEGHEEVELPI